MGELRFDGRVALVSGAGRGLGRAYAELLAERGAGVVVNDLGSGVGGSGSSSAPAEEVTEHIRSLGRAAIANASDISSADGAAAAVQAAVEEYGRLDIVVNNAGNFEPRLFGETDADNLRAHFDTHVGGSFNLTRAAWPHLMASESGRVVLVTSIAIFGIPGYVSYGTAKAALVGMTTNLAYEGAEHGIKVNAVCPVANTRMAIAGGMTQEQLDGLRADLKVRQHPERVAPLVAFLAHESFPHSGRIYEAGHGRFARLFIAECPGYVHEGATIEDVAANMAAVENESGYVVPGTALESLPHLRYEEDMRAG